MTGIEIGSENVFDDLGYYDSERSFRKHELVVKINKAVTKRQLSNIEVGRLLGITEMQAIVLEQGASLWFTEEQLIGFLNKIEGGSDV